MYSVVVHRCFRACTHGFSKVEAKESRLPRFLARLAEAVFVLQAQSWGNENSRALNRCKIGYWTNRHQKQAGAIEQVNSNGGSDTKLWDMTYKKRTDPQAGSDKTCRDQCFILHRLRRKGRRDSRMKLQAGRAPLSLIFGDLFHIS